MNCNYLTVWRSTQFSMPPYLNQHIRVYLSPPKSPLSRWMTIPGNPPASSPWRRFCRTSTVITRSNQGQWHRRDASRQIHRKGEIEQRRCDKHRGIFPDSLLTLLFLNVAKLSRNHSSMALPNDKNLILEMISPRLHFTFQFCRFLFSARSLRNCSSTRANAAGKTAKSHTWPSNTYSSQRSESIDTLHSLPRATHDPYRHMTGSPKDLMDYNKQEQRSEAFSDKGLEIRRQGMVRSRNGLWNFWN